MDVVRYEIERVLGRGGMATVYLARDVELDRPVAIKVLAEHLAGDEEYRARFLREARAAAGLVHASIVQVYDVGEDERGLFIVMEYVEGTSLAEELVRRGTIPPEKAVAIAVQVCAGLEAAHAAGLVHRDVTPQNILLRGDGAAKLSDFGIARTLDQTTRLTEHGTVLGTAAYLAPEQARGGPVTAAADLYSLGLVLYELLTGRRPFEAENLPALLLQREQGTVALPRELAPEVPQTLEEAVIRCLARAAEDRPESAAALARALAGSLAEPPTHALPEPTGVRATEVLASSAPTRRLRRVRSNWRRLPASRPAERLGWPRRSSSPPSSPWGSSSQATARKAARSNRTTRRLPRRARPRRRPRTRRAEQPSRRSPPRSKPLPASSSSGAKQGLEERKQALEEQKKRIEERKQQAKDEAQRAALEQEKQAVED
jgi:eukaryotic-like serine/threonine-protein kinase